MKKGITCILVIISLLVLAGCGRQAAQSSQILEGNLKTYDQLSDGTWVCDGHAYQYLLELNGTMPNAKASSTFVYLSNIEDITFQQAYLAAGISSNLDDYFAVEDAVLVAFTTG